MRLVMLLVWAATVYALNTVLPDVVITPKPAPPVSADGRDKWQVFIDWLKASNATFPKVSIKQITPEYRELHLTKPVVEGEPIVSIPHDLMLSYEVAKASEIGVKIASAECKLRSSHTWLAAYVCQERLLGNASFWSPYLNILPSEFGSMPIHLDDSEWKFLDGSFVVENIYYQAEELIMEYDGLVQCLPQVFANISRSDFVWARLAVGTRMFGFDYRGTYSGGLVPMADMVNHRRPRMASWGYHADTNAFALTAVKEFNASNDASSELFISYGMKCNSRLFVNYGFVLRENEFNTAVVYLQLRKRDPLYWIKLRLLDTAQTVTDINSRRKFQIPIQYRENGDSYSGLSTQHMFSYARFLVATNTDFAALLTDRFDPQAIAFLNIRNERAALRLIEAAARTALQLFKTTMDQDDEILDNPKYNLTTNIRHCILMRRGEKAILHHYVEMHQYVSPLFDLPLARLKQSIDEFDDQHTDEYSDYIEDVVVPLVARHALSSSIINAITNDLQRTATAAIANAEAAAAQAAVVMRSVGVRDAAIEWSRVVCRRSNSAPEEWNVPLSIASERPTSSPGPTPDTVSRAILAAEWFARCAVPFVNASGVVGWDYGGGWLEDVDQFGGLARDVPDENGYYPYGDDFDDSDGEADPEWSPTEFVSVSTNGRRRRRRVSDYDDEEEEEEEDDDPEEGLPRVRSAEGGRLYTFR